MLNKVMIALALLAIPVGAQARDYHRYHGRHYSHGYRERGGHWGGHRYSRGHHRHYHR